MCVVCVVCVVCCVLCVVCVYCDFEKEREILQAIRKTVIGVMTKLHERPSYCIFLLQRFIDGVTESFHFLSHKCHNTFDPLHRKPLKNVEVSVLLLLLSSFSFPFF